ncbi:MAG: hypothetical protein HWD57_20175 [Candidatus Accumulibacter cognatus]|uniref:Uncharacterized protein n=1 Tax=Candidatus Accumulibacter cognatus TaxID=2954383 RepID=A0A7D5NF11_9PROT|nr:MAG: hypothetical protein HWD57_20175 [Candidatus Accumulibacter cognatus]
MVADTLGLDGRLVARLNQCQSFPHLGQLNGLCVAFRPRFRHNPDADIVIVAAVIASS